MSTTRNFILTPDESACPWIEERELWPLPKIHLHVAPAIIFPPLPPINITMPRLRLSEIDYSLSEASVLWRVYAIAMALVTLPLMLPLLLRGIAVEWAELTWAQRAAGLAAAIVLNVLWVWAAWAVVGGVACV
jgi:hypothetical protein